MTYEEIITLKRLALTFYTWSEEELRQARVEHKNNPGSNEILACRECAFAYRRAQAEVEALIRKEEAKRRGND